MMDGDLHYNGNWVWASVLALGVVALAAVNFARRRCRGSHPRPPRPFLLDGALVALYKGDLPDATVASHTKGGPVYGRYFLGQDTVYVSGASNIRKVLIGENSIVASLWPPAIKSLLGHGSLSNNGGAVHARLRRMMQPAFTPLAVQSYVPLVTELIYSALEAWASADGPVSAYKVVNSLTLQIAIRVIAGSRGSWTMPGNLEGVEHLVHEWLAGLFAWPVDLPWTRFGKAWKARRQLLKLVDEALAATADGNRQGTVMEVMLENASTDALAATQEELRDNVMTLLFAGHDTSATAMICMLEEMRKHPDKLQAIRDEQTAVVATHGETFTADALAGMPLTEGWIKESMRRTPVVPVIPRTAIAEFEVGGCTVCPGQRVIASVRSCMQQDPRFEAEGPLEFKPERWLSKETARDGAWMPFGAGPRLCLGNLLSVVELKIFMSLLMRRYSVVFLDNSEPWYFIPLAKPLHGMPIKVLPAANALG